MRRLLLTSVAALATVLGLAASIGAVRAAPSGGDLGPDARFYVTSVSPARNQETMPDLSDPGLNTQIWVKFSAYPRAADLLDEQNLVNGLSRRCAFLDQAFAPVHAASSVTRNLLRIDPFDARHAVLPVGRYSITLKSSIRSARGRLLNDGRGGFATRFSVGSGYFPVVLSRVTPRDGQTDVGPRRNVIASFDVALDPETAWQAVRLEDRSTEPPTPIDALVTLDRGGMDVVVVVASPGFAPGAEVALVIQGRGSATEGVVLKSADGIEFKRDWGPRWTADAVTPTLFHSALGDYDDATGTFTMTFRARDTAR